VKVIDIALFDCAPAKVDLYTVRAQQQFEGHEAAGPIERNIPARHNRAKGLIGWVWRAVSNRKTLQKTLVINRDVTTSEFTGRE